MTEVSSSKMKRIGELGGGLIINHLNPPILQGAGQMLPSPGAVSLSPHNSCHLFLTCPHTVGYQSLHSRVSQTRSIATEMQECRAGL